MVVEFVFLVWFGLANKVFNQSNIIATSCIFFHCFRGCGCVLHSVFGSDASLS